MSELAVWKDGACWQEVLHTLRHTLNVEINFTQAKRFSASRHCLAQNEIFTCGRSRAPVNSCNCKESVYEQIQSCPSIHKPSERDYRVIARRSIESPCRRLRR